MFQVQRSYLWPRFFFRQPANLHLERNIGTISLATKELSAEEKKQNPSVLLLGWAFAKDKQLAKFADFHNRLGYNTLAHTSDQSLFFSYDHAAMKQEATRLVEKLKVMQGDHDGSVVVHIFSNAGYFVYQHIAEILYDHNPDQTGLRLSGLILDSGPIPFTYKFMLKRGANFNANHKPNWNFLTFAYIFLQYMTEGAGLFGPTRTALAMRQNLRRNWKQFYPKYLSPGEHVVKNTRKYPQLFLYSDADTLAPAKFFELAIREQRALGQVVFEHNFRSSGHVAHLKKFPDVYKEKAKEFFKYIKKH